MSELGVRKSELESNFNQVAGRIDSAFTERLKTDSAAGKPRLVAVSKTKPSEDIQIAYDLGYRHFGENYVQELVEKAAKLPKDIKWHFIGHLQSNKAKIVASIPNLYVVETVDSIKIADALNKHRTSENPLRVFLQVNTSNEETKSGTTPDTLSTLVSHVLTSCPNLRIAGLMTIGEAGSSDDFVKLVKCKEAVEQEFGAKLSGKLELSMGMSGDFEEAIKYGSSNVRIGSTLFGARLYPKKEH
ncbi:hypothetical protein BKA69DRAFT_1123676 [Paraphysoderma sedebokerense]|nr:hypothetical protein BKA69DRAFT_1123676 [Paraphysoderma sedebokerense]